VEGEPTRTRPHSGSNRFIQLNLFRYYKTFLCHLCQLVKYIYIGAEMFFQAKPPQPHTLVSMTEAITGNACAVWECRWNADGVSASEIIDSLKGIAKKYTFQREVSDTGYNHYQGRISLCKRRRYSEKHIVLKLFKHHAPNFFTPTANENFQGEAFYVMKEDTRVEGPWADTDEVKILTYQLKLFQGWDLRPYQQKLTDLAVKFSMRKIDLIYDPLGNCGKSLFSEYLEYQGFSEEVPPFRLMDDIFQWVASRPIKKCYVFDMPRGMKKDKLADFYAGIEVIKNGVAYDKRYGAKKIRFDRPRVFVFTNTLPVFNLMSADRWDVWQMTEEYDLEKYIQPTLIVPPSCESP